MTLTLLEQPCVGLAEIGNATIRSPELLFRGDHRQVPFLCLRWLGFEISSRELSALSVQLENKVACAAPVVPKGQRPGF
ncbi:Hypothetical predicted protein [Marmota monax]|uniref:Uncharacterized protein n=1 Tax=Marmota monax TaxID=9995 RepID=A0A5E4A303_MARMO|nr:hypothetical protein GHT09_001072 [Marmota monax]VTJ51051.1 Hypothetical predicted protein [Marmota monax]